MVEILTGLIGVVIYIKLGFSWYMPFVFFSFASLLALSMIDFDYMAVPDSVNIAALIFALIQPDFLHALLNGLVAAGGLFLLGWIASKLARREAMGSADIIVAGTMGALLGFPLFFIALFLSAILALVPSLIWRENGVPFVPFLALATLIIYFFDTEAQFIVNKIIYG
jgi:leader peptidase (prepilin peptidase)/N-methyltransferase